jgi:hypothetical protein
MVCFLNLAAGETPFAAVLAPFLAVQYLGQCESGKSLANPLWATEKIRMRETVV